MKYFRVKKEFDGRLKNNGDSYIANELYTEKELQKQGLNTRVMEEVSLSKNNTYLSFGVRFQVKQA